MIRKTERERSDQTVDQSSHHYLSHYFSTSCLFPCFHLLVISSELLLQGDFSGVDRKVLVLGAGYVSAPVIEYLTRDPSVGVTVAAEYKKDANSLAERSVTQVTVKPIGSSVR